MSRTVAPKKGEPSERHDLVEDLAAPLPDPSADQASAVEEREPSVATSDERPWVDSRFWILQLAILAIYLIGVAVTLAFHLDNTSPAVEFSTLALFLIPVVYAATSYGFRGAVVTTGWVTLLAIPRFLSLVHDREYVTAWAEVMQVVVLDALAILIGQRVSAERHARRLAESTREAHLSAEALYRDLFDSNQAPILIVDSNGYIAEANASATRAFGVTSPLLTGPARVRLVDTIGPDAAAQVLTQLISNQLPDGHDGGETAATTERVEPLAFDIEGERILFRPTATMLGRSDHDKRMQVVFENVTAETRRHDLMEAYAARVVLGQEEERRHIAQELHDGPVQSLIHLCRQIDAVGAQADSSDGGLTLAGLRVIVEDSVSELRSIAKGLRPSILDDLGLVASINQMLTDAGERQHFATSFGVTGPERRLPQAVELALFRIAQEALSNVERHANAHQVAVGVDFESLGLRLLVKDDGVGFDTTQGPQDNGTQSLGVPGMTERAHLIGSRLVIHSGRGVGTTVDVWVPATIINKN